MKTILTILLSLFLTGTAICQIELNGTIVDIEAKAWFGARIVELNNDTNYTYSDSSGNFSISVNDTSSIQIKYGSINDTVIAIKDFPPNGNIIIYRSKALWDELSSSLSHRTSGRICDSYSISLYGDVNRMPFGVAISTYQPYLFKNKLFFNSSIYSSCKTDFIDNTHLRVGYDKNDIIKNKKYRLSGGIKFSLRDLNINQTNYRVNEYGLCAYNSLFNMFGFSIGAYYRDYIYSNSYWGYWVSTGKFIQKTRSSISGSIHLIENGYEYFIGFSQYTPDNILYGRLELSLNYRKYIAYDEFNIGLAYTFVR